MCLQSCFVFYSRPSKTIYRTFQSRMAAELTADQTVFAFSLIQSLYYITVLSDLSTVGYNHRVHRRKS